MIPAGFTSELTVLGAPNTQVLPRGARPGFTAVGSFQQTRDAAEAMGAGQLCWELPTSALPRTELSNPGVQS